MSFVSPLAEVAARKQFREVISNKSKSFALASKLLPNWCRADVIALYAFCRRADDAVDLAPPNELGQRVEALYAEVDSIYAGAAQSDAVLAAFANLVQKYAIPIDYPRELIAGMEMDAMGYRYQSFQDVLLYAYRVAGVVGLMLCQVFGVRSPRALRQAAELGIAMQLTNISRDVAEDWLRRRLYLPEPWVPASARAERGEIAGLLAFRSEVEPQVFRLLNRADAYYKSAGQGILALPFRVALAVAVARSVYSEIGAVIRSPKFSFLERRAQVSWARKLWLALVAVITTSLSFLRYGRVKSDPHLEPSEHREISTVALEVRRDVLSA